MIAPLCGGGRSFRYVPKSVVGMTLRRLSVGARYHCLNHYQQTGTATITTTKNANTACTGIWNGTTIPSTRTVKCTGTTIPSRSFSSSTLANGSSATPNAHATLYQYAICPYCNIAKAVLRYTKTPFDIIEVNPLTKAELKNKSGKAEITLPDSSYRKVPILTWTSDMKNDDDTEVIQVNGSEQIVEQVLDRWNMTQPNISSSSSSLDTTSDSAIQWTTFAREDLAPLLYPNLCSTLMQSWKAFGYVWQINDNSNNDNDDDKDTTKLPSSSSFTTLQKISIQTLGSVAMYFAASKIKKKRNITDEKEALQTLLTQLEETLSTRPFLNDSNNNKNNQNNEGQPHLGDLTTYGVLRGLEGLDIMEEIVLCPTSHPHIQQWYQRMQTIVEFSTTSMSSSSTTR